MVKYSIPVERYPIISVYEIQQLCSWFVILRHDVIVRIFFEEFWNSALELEKIGLQTFQF